MRSQKLIRGAAVVCVLAVLTGGALGQSRAERSWEALQQREDFDRALRIAVREAEADESLVVRALSAAKSAASMDNGAEAGRWLTECAARGYSGITTVETAAEFAGVLGDEGYLAGVEAVRERAAARFEKFEAAALEHEPAVIEPDGGMVDNDEALLVIVLHGTGGRGGPIAESLAQSLADGGVRAVVVGPDGLRPSGGGFSWTFVDEASWFVEQLVERYTTELGIGRDRVVLVGFSQGANILLSLIRQKPVLMGEIGGSVMVCGHVENDLIAFLGSDAAPGFGVESKPPRVYLMIGARDPWVSTYREGVGVFEAAGIAVEKRELRGGHEFPGGALGAAEFGRAIGFLVDPEPGP